MSDDKGEVPQITPEDDQLLNRTRGIRGYDPIADVLSQDGADESDNYTQGLMVEKNRQKLNALNALAGERGDIHPGIKWEEAKRILAEEGFETIIARRYPYQMLGHGVEHIQVMPELIIAANIAKKTLLVIDSSISIMHDKAKPPYDHETPMEETFSGGWLYTAVQPKEGVDKMGAYYQALNAIESSHNPLRDPIQFVEVQIGVGSSAGLKETMQRLGTVGEFVNWPELDGYERFHLLDHGPDMQLGRDPQMQNIITNIGGAERERERFRTLVTSPNTPQAVKDFIGPQTKILNYNG